MHHHTPLELLEEFVPLRMMPQERLYYLPTAAVAEAPKLVLVQVAVAVAEELEPLA